MSEELKKRFARSAAERQRSIRDRVRAVIRTAIPLVVLTIAVIAAIEFGLPWILRPNAETRAAYEAVATNLEKHQPFEALTEKHRDLFLENSEWTEEDVQLVDMTVQKASEALRAAEGGSFTAPSSVWACHAAASKLREWDADEALEILKSAQ